MIPELAIDFAGLRLTSPLVLAAGTCGYVDELAPFSDLASLGAVITKSITAQPREGNAVPRIIGVPTGMLNAIGLANVGIEAFMAEKAPRIASCPTLVFGSAAGHSVEEYVTVCRAFDACPEIPAVELNVSCPNTDTGLVFGESPAALAELLKEVRPALSQTKLIVKLSPNAPSIVEMAGAAVEGGAEALALVNTFTALSIDVETRRSRIARGYAGYSGPGIHPIAVRMVHEVYTKVARKAGVPILGYGGVMNWRDAVELMLAGATAVGMGTALFADPRSPGRVLAGMKNWLSRQRDSQSISDVVGSVVLSY